MMHTAYEVAEAILKRLAGEWGDPETAMDHVVEVASILTEQSPAIPLWQAIETCPQRTDVLMAWPNGRLQIEQLDDSRKSFWYPNAPTYWMPLPEPPEAEKIDA